MVKLQKHKAYIYKSERGDKIEHFKHLVTIPEDSIRLLGWSEGDDLETSVKGNALILKKREASAGRKER